MAKRRKCIRGLLFVFRHFGQFDGDMWKEWLLKPCDGEVPGENERNDEFDGEIPNENGEFEAERVRRRRHENDNEQKDNEQDN